MKYVVVENTPGYLPEDPEPFVGEWNECCSVMDDTIERLLDVGYTVVQNDGVGFRTPGGIRRTYLMPSDPSEYTLSRVVEIIEASPHFSH